MNNILGKFDRWEGNIHKKIVVTMEDITNNHTCTELFRKFNSLLDGEFSLPLSFPHLLW
jgi:hypothetical protein